jgi:hypothetical protein
VLSLQVMKIVMRKMKVGKEGRINSMKRISWRNGCSKIQNLKSHPKSFQTSTTIMKSKKIFSRKKLMTIDHNFMNSWFHFKFIYIISRILGKIVKIIIIKFPVKFSRSGFSYNLE